MSDATIRIRRLPVRLEPSQRRVLLRPFLPSLVVKPALAEADGAEPDGSAVAGVGLPGSPEDRSLALAGTAAAAESPAGPNRLRQLERHLNALTADQVEAQLRHAGLGCLRVQAVEDRYLDVIGQLD